MTKSLTDDFSKVTEVELVYRNKSRPSTRLKISCSKDAYDLFLRTWDDGKIELQEQFRVMFLDRSNGCLGISTVSSGGISTCVADPKIIFASALKAGAASIIIAHNHPSGSLKPSKPDTALTERFCYVGRMLDMPVLDHLIVTREGYFSFADEGMTFGTSGFQPPLAASSSWQSPKGGL